MEDEVAKKREHLRDSVIRRMMNTGTWEPIDTWGNGEIRLTDPQSIEFAEWVVDLVAFTWEEGHVTGWYDGLYSDPENGRPKNNPYRKDDDGK